ncbi:MAG: addiction module protein [Armatimonadetes bacterium]|nr:addiction module protein [Armatimonadota bacterium]
MTVDSVFADAMSLPEEDRSDLLDRLLAAVAPPIDPELERAHVEIANRRAQEMISGAVKGIPVAEGLARVRAMVRR